MVALSTPGADGETQLLQWAVAWQPIPGQQESGDLFLVEPYAQGALVAAVDGVGHGREAAVAARIAVDTLRSHAQESPISLCIRCHEMLKGTRGVTVSMASFWAEDDSMTWLSVGNVEGILRHANAQAKPLREFILQRPGVVGYRLPPLSTSVLHVARGDTLLFWTDGISFPYGETLDLSQSPRQIANRICQQYRKGDDDALVVVARYLGGQHD